MPKNQDENPNVIEYRTFFFDPDSVVTDRATDQAFFKHHENASKWADVKLMKGGPKSEVIIYKILEVCDEHRRTRP